MFTDISHFKEVGIESCFGDAVTESWFVHTRRTRCHNNAVQFVFDNIFFDFFLPRTSTGIPVNATENYIVHFRGPVKSQWVDSLYNRGVSRVLQQVPKFALLVEVPSGVTVDFSSIPGVDWSGM